MTKKEGKRTTIYLDPDLHQKMKVYAAKAGKSMTEIIEELIKELFKKK